VDFVKLKSELIKKYIENKNFLASMDIWSQITGLNYFTFRVSQLSFRYLQSNPDIKVLEQGVSAGKLAVMIKIPEMKLDEFRVDKLEIVQDIEIKSEGTFYSSANFNIRKDFNTKNSLNQKALRIFDLRYQTPHLTLRVEKPGGEFIELIATL
jgi:hypothetical protein